MVKEAHVLALCRENVFVSGGISMHSLTSVPVGGTCWSFHTHQTESGWASRVYVFRQGCLDVFWKTVFVTVQLYFDQGCGPRLTTCNTTAVEQRWLISLVLFIHAAWYSILLEFSTWHSRVHPYKIKQQTISSLNMGARILYGNKSWQR
jgi:hypothetical protein